MSKLLMVVGLVVMLYGFGMLFFNGFEPNLRQDVNSFTTQYIQRDTFDTVYHTSVNVKVWTDPKYFCEYLIAYSSHAGGQPTSITPRLNVDGVHVCHSN